MKGKYGRPGYVGMADSQNRLHIIRCTIWTVIRSTAPIILVCCHISPNSPRPSSENRMDDNNVKPQAKEFRRKSFDGQVMLSLFSAPIFRVFQIPLKNKNKIGRKEPIYFAAEYGQGQHVRAFVATESIQCPEK